MTAPVTLPAPAPVTETDAPVPVVPGLTAAQVILIIALLRAQAENRERLSSAAIAGVLAAFEGFAGWFDTAAINQVVRQVLRIVQPAQRQAARLTDAYLARVLTIMSGRNVRPVGPVDVARLRHDLSRSTIDGLNEGRIRPGRVILGDDRDGPADTIDDDLDGFFDPDRGPYLDPGDAYGRVADYYRRQVIVEGKTEEEARRKAHVRLAAVADTDVTLAIRQQYYKALKAGRTVRADGWRRILRPELGRGGPPCGLCVVAADRIYKREDLQPIHDRCRCEVLPILDTLDPGLYINREDLDRIYAAAGSTGGGRRQRGALKRIRVALDEHAELGPVLVDAEQHYRGPVEVARAKSADPEVSRRAQIASLEKSFDVLERKRASGADYNRAAYAWQQNRLAELRAA